jgi:hypothetical protein
MCRRTNENCFDMPGMLIARVQLVQSSPGGSPVGLPCNKEGSPQVRTHRHLGTVAVFYHQTKENVSFYNPYQIESQHAPLLVLRYMDTAEVCQRTPSFRRSLAWHTCYLDYYSTS